MIRFNHAKGNYEVTVSPTVGLGVPGEPMLNFGVSERHGHGTVVPLTYLQVMKMRDELNDWLGRNFGKGQPPWEGSINER